MCGIAGLVYADASRPCDRETVVAMRDIMPYRGPDDSGLYVDGPLGFGAHSDQERINESELYKFVRYYHDVVVDVARAR